jgi:hypothetical protein
MRDKKENLVVTFSLSRMEDDRRIYDQYIFFASSVGGKAAQWEPFKPFCCNK